MWILWKWIRGTRAINSLGQGTDHDAPSAPSSLPHRLPGKLFWSGGTTEPPFQGDTCSPRRCFLKCSVADTWGRHRNFSAMEFCSSAAAVWSLKTSWARGGFLLLNSPWWIFCSENSDSHFWMQASLWHLAAQKQFLCSLVHKDLLLSVCFKPVSR